MVGHSFATEKAKRHTRKTISRIAYEGISWAPVVTRAHARDHGNQKGWGQPHGYMPYFGFGSRF